MPQAAVLRCTLFALALGGATASRADALAGAQRAYADVDYARCRDEAGKALAAPADKPARVDAWRYLGLCAAALGDTEQAREAFKRMLAIDRDARLPEGLSPRFTSSFREAKGSFLTGAPLSFTIEQQTVEGGLRAVRLKVVDELGLVHKIGWRGAAGSSGGPVRAAALLELEVPAEADVTIYALDPQGGEVALLFLPARTSGAAEPVATAPPAPPDDGFPWLVVGGVAAGVLVLGAVGAGLAAYLAPPQAVTLSTDVVFP
jgi:hypothetical protein